MEDWVHVLRYVPTPLDPSTAAVSLDTHCLHQDMPATVRTCTRITAHIIHLEALVCELCALGYRLMNLTAGCKYGCYVPDHPLLPMVLKCSHSFM